VRDFVGLQSVLILRIAASPAYTDVLDGLKVQRRARNSGELPAESRNHLVGRHFADADVLELSEHTSGVFAAAAGERSDRINGGIFLDNASERRHFRGHRGKRSVLISLNAAA